MASPVIPASQTVSPVVSALIPVKNSLKQQQKFQTISDTIITHIKQLPEPDFKNVELIQYICDLIEFLVRKRYKLDKECLMIFTMKRIFPDISDEDVSFIKQTVQYLIDNKLIKVVKTSEFIGMYAKKFIRSKLPL